MAGVWGARGVKGKKGTAICFGTLSFKSKIQMSKPKNKEQEQLSVSCYNFSVNPANNSGWGRDKLLLEALFPGV